MFYSTLSKKLPAFRLTLSVIFSLFFSISYSQTCNNWLYVPNQPSFVRIGDLDIPGNKITVEAMFVRTAPWNGADVFQGDLVSKHEGPPDCNYLLRPGSAEISTSNGYFKTPTICNIQLNKLYHAAMVYDGTSLKFYRNGFLMSQIAASGNLIQNNWQTQIGLYFNQLTQENFIGYINEVRIWDIARTQAEIRTYMNQSLPSPTTQTGLRAYYTFDNLLNKQGNSAWNGSLFGNASINQTNPNCTFVVDSCNMLPCANAPMPDFGFDQDVCNPKAVTFSTNSPNVKTYQWDFGNGQTSSNRNASTTFTNFGTYPVQLKVEYLSGCVGSITKSITVGLVQSDVIVTGDTTICSGDSVRLRTNASGLAFCWQPAASLESPIVKPSTTTAYTFTSKSIGSNLVTNGDFTGGNIGFTSSYSYSASGVTPAVYFVGTDPQAWHSGMTPCRDHTTGGGNMMLVNGANQKNVVVWSQTVTVTPHTNYAFSAWLQTLAAGSPAQLQFYINGEPLGNIFSADVQTCSWKQFYATWNSGAKTNAILTVVNMNEAFTGNDFALDDIFFGPVVMKQETVTITVAQRPGVNLGTDQSVCKGSSVQLNATMSDAQVIKWTPSLFLNDSNIPNPLSTPLQSIEYIAEVISRDGCNRRDTVSVSVVEKPTVTVRPDTTVCSGSSVVLVTQSSAADSFSWAPAVGLSNASVSNPIATPMVTTKFILSAKNTGCETKDSILVSVEPLPKVTISNDTVVCEGSTVHLSASGGVEYVWTPAAGLSSAFSANPIVTPLVTTKYTVAVKGANGCIQSDSVTVSLFAKPVLSIAPSIQSICNGEMATFKAFGGDSYKWLSVNDDSLSANSTLQVKPLNSSVYKVVIKESTCSVTDTLLAAVTVKPLPVVTLTKSNDIDCSKGEAQLSANGGASYEWFPSNGLSNAFVSDPLATPVQTTTYIVTVKSAEGCSSKDSITVDVSVSGKSGFHIPTAFTPNRDGKNDCLSVKNWMGVKEFSIHIYNRWGELVFFSKSPSFCWDGTFKGKEQPLGVYVYQMKANTLCGDVFKKGTVTIVR